MTDRRVLLPDNFVLGLVGELLVLRELLAALGSKLQSIADPTVVWRGWQQQARDFAIGPLSVEVKTTRLNVSRHMISGLEQVEPRRLDEQATEDLFLASIRLRRTIVPGGLSIAGLADQIIALLREQRGDAEGTLTWHLAPGTPNARHSFCSARSLSSSLLVALPTLKG